MLSTTDLRQRLSDIQAAYVSETDAVKALLHSKLAALEVGGWTEECIDKIVIDFLDTRNPKYKNKVMERLNSIYGFQYNKEFKSIIVELIGIIGFEKIESALSLECQQLESALSELKQSRDTCAHTYTKPTTAIDSPSRFLALLNRIEKTLTAFSLKLQTIELKP